MMSPFQFKTSNLEVGNHRFYAKMYIDEAFELSNVVKVQVGEQYPYNDKLNQIPGIIEAGHYDFFEEVLVKKYLIWT